MTETTPPLRWNLPPGGDIADGPRPSDGAITGIDGPDPDAPVPAQTTRARRYWSAHRLPLSIMSLALLLDAAASTTASPFYWAYIPALLLPAALAWIATP